ncbi:MAG: Asp-tRNA(Asn)/Glu-tRNA(Gln) amidotransferase subunit GatB [Oscillospiraceae bacterium]|nr:Asp-tRNA(Asn)/Glu-tRNA(Gln) amidotransferase subunit GatB [Oscillospiraceae bacterium]
MSWEIVMGLEVHAELSTKTKIFCGCPNDFGGAPNTHVCPICSGMPGTLPVLNRAVVEYAVKLGLALDCDITSPCQFDRKHYFYPDLPAAYQVSQLYVPICQNGHIDLDLDGVEKRIHIRQIHMEEDAGKLIHDPANHRTLMDFNRAGVPLLEIVSQPDFRSADEVIAYLEQLRETLIYLDICDGKMQEGSMRVDVNLSIRRPGGELGVRTEMKNLNSFKAIARAIEYESERQIDILESGGQLMQQTRRWDDDRGESYAMRSKENAQDYRYFPDPNLLPIEINAAWMTRLRDSLPELAHQKRARYVQDYGLSNVEANILTTHRNVSDLFEALIANSCEPRETTNLIVVEIMRLMNAHDTLPENLNIDTSKLATLIALVLDDKINRKAYKETIEAVFIDNVDPETYINDKGLLMVSDDGALAGIVAAVIATNPDAVTDHHNGKPKAFGFLMGQIMKQLGRSGNPTAAKKALEEKLKET